MRKNLINLVAFQLCWFVVVLSATKSHELIGIAAVAIHLALHFRFIAETRREALIIGIAMIVGFVVDSGFLIIGALEYPKEPLMLAWQPLWMAALWANFATSLNHSLLWVTKRPALAAMFGALGGPLAHWAGQQFGALSLSESPLQWLSALALGWGGSMLLLSALAGTAAEKGSVAE